MGVKSCSSGNAKDHVMRENETPKNLYGFLHLFCSETFFSEFIDVYDTVFRIYGGIML